MEKKKMFFIVFGLLMSLTSVGVGKEESIEISLTTDFMGKYIWRGQNLSDDPVFQPSIALGYESLTVSIWGNMDLTNINGNSGDFSELDYTVDYSDDLPGVEGVGYSVGVIYYDFPGTALGDTTEIYWGFNFDLPLSPSITVYHDLDEAEGSYVLVAVEHSIESVFELSPELPVGMSIGAGLGWGSGSYNKYYWGTDESKMQDLVFSMSFPMEIAGWTVTPNMSYVTLVSDDIRDIDVYGTSSDFFVAGISLSKSF